MLAGRRTGSRASRDPGQGARVGRAAPATALAGALVVACGGGGGAGNSTAAVAPVQHLHLSVGGADRTYRIYVPASVSPDRAAPFLIVLHAGAGSGDDIASTTGFDDVAAAYGFVVAYPDGTGRTWNTGVCCGTALAEGVDDVGFMRALLDKTEATHRIDPQRVYVAGVSNGAILAYWLACVMSDRIDAIGTVAGTMVIAGCQPAHPVSVLEIHGTADGLVPYQGGKLPDAATADRAAPAVPSSPVLAQRWAELDSCSGSPATTMSGAVTTTTWSGCAAGAGVGLVTVANGGHVWFAPGLGQPDEAVDATKAIWDFLRAHPRSG